MTTTNVKPRSEQLTQFFRFPEYLRAVGQLTKYNALEYFYQSEFFTNESGNAILRMQSDIGTGGLPPNQIPGSAPTQALLAWQRRNDPLIIEQELKRFIGIEFVLVHSIPPDLFVIHKRYRTSPNQTQIIEVYYILNGNITLTADLFTILQKRLIATTSAINQTLTLARNAQPAFNPREGHAWRIAVEKEEFEDEKGKNVQIENDEVMQES